MKLTLRVGHQKIGEAIAVQVSREPAKSEKAGRGRNGRCRSGRESPIALVEQHVVAVLGPDGHIEVTIVIEVGHLRVEHRRLRQRHSRLPAQDELVLALVLVEQGGAIIAIEKKVGVAVVREIGKHCPAHAPLGRFEAGGSGLIRERPIAVVAIEVDGRAGEIVGKSEGVLGGGFAQVGVRGHDEVQQAVVVGVEEDGARVNYAGLGLHPRLLRNILKPAIARVAIDLHAVKSRYEQAHLAAVIKVSERGGQARARSRDPCFLRYVA